VNLSFSQAHLHIYLLDLPAMLLAKLMFIVWLVLFLLSSLDQQQTHPLSQITPIDVNLNMNGYSIININ